MSIPGIEDWLQTPQGRYIMAWERTHINAIVLDSFGYNALQVGLPEYNLLAQNRIPLKQTVATCGLADVLCDPTELPFSANSIDLVVLPHALEFSSDPHQVLREIERILIPEGQLVLTGFNPYSLWGLKQRARKKSPCVNFPFAGNYISVQRLKDWLQLLGFEVDRGCFGCYAPPFEQQSWLRRFRFMEAAGDRWWGFAGGVYMLRAVKKVKGMRIIMPSWKSQHTPSPNLNPITHKGSS